MYRLIIFIFVYQALMAVAEITNLYSSYLIFDKKTSIIIDSTTAVICLIYLIINRKKLRHQAKVAPKIPPPNQGKIATELPP